MGMFRWLMAPVGIVAAEDMNAYLGWGLLEVSGRTVRIIRAAELQPARNSNEELAVLVQAVANAQLCAGRDLNEWFACPETPLGKLRAVRRAIAERERQSQRERECGRYIGTDAEGRMTYCKVTVAGGYYACSEHGGRTRGEKRKQAYVTASYEQLREERREHAVTA